MILIFKNVYIAKHFKCPDPEILKLGTQKWEIPQPEGE